MKEQRREGREVGRKKQGRAGRWRDGGREEGRVREKLTPILYLEIRNSIQD